MEDQAFRGGQDPGRRSFLTQLTCVNLGGGKGFQSWAGFSNWTRGVKPCSEGAVGVSQAAALIPSHTRPGTDQQRRWEVHGELSTLLLFQPAWHLAQVSP